MGNERENTSEARGFTFTVLVVDDNEANRMLARIALEDEGCEVVLAASGEEALRAFHERRPDGVLLDIRMPGVDGTAVCTQIRELPEGVDTPIVFLTAARDVDTFDKAFQAGGDDFLIKPVQPAELVARIKSAMTTRRLGAELREQIDIVKQQRDSLMRLQLQKEELSAFIVHDLKNPVSAMDLHAQLLLRDPVLPGSLRDSVLHMRSEARALMRMIVNLLDVSKADEAALRPAVVDVDLEPLLRDVFDELHVKAAAAGVALETALAAKRLHADADLLRRVVENLVDNALRYAPRGSRVAVSSASTKAGVTLRVRDEGRGIPDEMKATIFERYAQVQDGARAGASNRGLGLAFCKLVAEAHGGRIWVEDAEPGAAFCVSIPRAREGAEHD